MARQNRVDPRGALVADPARGAFLGNRGLLHDRHGRIRREWQLERWITCVLEFKGRRREIMRPGHYTELFFFDEPTALAAGHRPCAECRRQSYNAYREAWIAGNPGRVEPGERIGAPAIDRVLHADRLAGSTKRTYEARLGDLPDGAFVDAPPRLVWGGRLFEWSARGYGAPTALRPSRLASVLTPRSTVNALAAGFAPAPPPI